MKGCREITCKYYSKWLGQEDILLRDFKGVEYIYSAQRNIVPHGYGVQYDIYALYQKNRIVVSYGDRARDRLDMLRDAVGNVMPAGEIRQILSGLFEREAGHSIKYVFEQLPAAASRARVMTPEDYRAYEDFWKKCHPGCMDTEWLKEYFEEMAQEHVCVGVFDGDVLASCTDAPGMPYMENDVQEIGINTLSEYRGHGYASAACVKCLGEILHNHKAPLWSAPADNRASRRLAEKLGFAEFAEVVMMTL